VGSPAPCTETCCDRHFRWSHHICKILPGCVEAHSKIPIREIQTKHSNTNVCVLFYDKGQQHNTSTRKYTFKQIQDYETMQRNILSNKSRVQTSYNALYMSNMDGPKIRQINKQPSGNKILKAKHVFEHIRINQKQMPRIYWTQIVTPQQIHSRSRVLISMDCNSVGVSKYCKLQHQMLPRSHARSEKPSKDPYQHRENPDSVNTVWGINCLLANKILESCQAYIWVHQSELIKSKIHTYIEHELLLPNKSTAGLGYWFRWIHNSPRESI